MAKKNRSGIGFAIWFLFCAGLALAWVGFIVWAIYSVVSWLITK